MLRSLHPISALYTFFYRQLYTRLAWAYDGVSWLVSLGRWDGWRRVALGFVSGADVLEVGFGTGELLSEMASRGMAVTGLEPSAAMQRITARKLGVRGQDVPRVQGFAQALPFADATFDTVLSTFPAGFATDPATHAEFARILRPGGWLVIVDVALCSDNPLLRLLYSIAFPPKPGATAKFRQALDGSGLRIAGRIVGQGAVRVVVTLGEKVASDARVA
ncbi:MAG: class I SAM-dependent methyltransferase [Chloroflexi bacterium]|nr:MAG: class I SAM-dependent methyltransferase [Chloroflexota bacterium]